MLSRAFGAFVSIFDETYQCLFIKNQSTINLCLKNNPYLFDWTDTKEYLLETGMIKTLFKDLLIQVICFAVFATAAEGFNLHASSKALENRASQISKKLSSSK